MLAILNAYHGAQKFTSPYFTGSFPQDFIAASSGSFLDKFEQLCLKPADTDVYALIDDLELKFQQIIDDNAW